MCYSSHKLKVDMKITCWKSDQSKILTLAKKRVKIIVCPKLIYMLFKTKRLPHFPEVFSVMNKISLLLSFLCTWSSSKLSLDEYTRHFSLNILTQNPRKQIYLTLKCYFFLVQDSVLYFQTKIIISRVIQWK